MGHQKKMLIPLINAPVNAQKLAYHMNSAKWKTPFPKMFLATLHSLHVHSHTKQKPFFSSLLPKSSQAIQKLGHPPTLPESTGQACPLQRPNYAMSHFSVPGTLNKPEIAGGKISLTNTHCQNTYLGNIS